MRLDEAGGALILQCTFLNPALWEAVLHLRNLGLGIAVFDTRSSFERVLLLRFLAAVVAPRRLKRNEIEQRFVGLTKWEGSLTACRRGSEPIDGFIAERPPNSS
jgi:hypothetical protein